MMTYDERLEADIKRHTDAKDYLWHEVYETIRLNLTYPGYIPRVDSKQEAEDILDRLQDEIAIALIEIKDMKETDLA